MILTDIVNSIKEIGKNIIKNPFRSALGFSMPFVAGINLANASQGGLEISHDMNDVSYDNYDCKLIHVSGAFEEPNDSLDRNYSPRNFSPNGKGSKIVSIVDSNELKVDAKPEDSNTPVNLELSLHKQDGSSMILVNHENSLKFSYAPHPDWEFGTEPITYWEKDPCDPNYACLVANVRKEILQGIGGVGEVPLENLEGEYISEDPYLKAGIRYDIYDSDLNEDGRVDLRDYNIFANNWKRTGISDSQRSNPPDPGAWADFNLDNQVDFKDLACFNDLWVYDGPNKFKW